MENYPSRRRLPKITLAAAAVILQLTIAWALDDTPENRSREADRYFMKYPLQTGSRQPIEQLANSLPVGVRQKVIDLVIINFNSTALEKTMKDSLIEHFTADELKALADSDDPAVRKSIVHKSDAFMSEADRAFGTEASEAVAKASPEIIKAILDDGRLGIRVKRNSLHLQQKMQKKIMRWYLRRFVVICRLMNGRKKRFGAIPNDNLDRS